MRIISGTHRGRNLITPKGDNTRPTADRIKESLFAIILPHLRDAIVLDVFAGSGALSFESLSRGAAQAVLIEPDREAIKAITTNIEALKYGDQTKLLRAEWTAVLPTLAGDKFDIIFIDPPYRMVDEYKKVIAALDEYQLLSDDALIICEHSASLVLPDTIACLDVYDRRKYGDTMITFLFKKEAKL